MLLYRDEKKNHDGDSLINNQKNTTTVLRTARVLCGLVFFRRWRRSWKTRCIWGTSWQLRTRSRGEPQKTWHPLTLLRHRLRTRGVVSDAQTMRRPFATWRVPFASILTTFVPFAVPQMTAETRIRGQQKVVRTAAACRQGTTRHCFHFHRHLHWA